MGIRETRYEKLIEKIIKEELQEGNLPSSKEFLWRITKELDNQDINSPEFKYRPVVRGRTASSYWFNKDYKEIYNDLASLYTNIVSLNNELNSNLAKFDTEKEKIENNINTLENELKEKILLYSDNGLLSTLFEVFDDMSKVDQVNTTAEIDLKNHYATIPSIKNTSHKIVAEASTSFSLLDSIKKLGTKQIISGKPDNGLTEFDDEVWQEMYLFDDKQYVAGYYYINFENKQKINQIHVKLQSVLPTDIKIEFTSDEINWFNLPYHEESRSVLDEYIFNFEPIEVKEVRILLGKKDADDETVGDQFIGDSTSMKYKYIFGLKHVGFYELTYPKEAVFESIVMDASKEDENFSINQVSLSVKSNIPQATNIEYFISVNGEDNEIEEEWYPISSVEDTQPQHTQMIDFKNITEAAPIPLMIEEEKSLSEYRLDDLDANGIEFYKLGAIDEKTIISGTERLYIGRDTWSVKKYFEEKEVGHIPSIEDWYENKDFLYEYIEMEDGLASNLLSSQYEEEYCNYMFKAGLLSEADQTIETVIPVSNEPISIYVNGILVFQGTPTSKSRATFSFEYGWNEVIILLYNANKNSNNGSSLDIGIDLREYSKNVYAQQDPMDKVDLHNLRYNVLANDRSSYALYEVNDLQYVVLNYAEPNLKYDFYFNYIEGEVVKYIKFRAVLTKDEQQSSIAPKLNQYRLRFG